MRTMIVRDIHATLNGDETVFEAPSGGIQVVGANGRTTIEIREHEDGSITINSHESGIVILPHASNNVTIRKI